MESFEMNIGTSLWWTKTVNDGYFVLAIILSEHHSLFLNVDGRIEVNGTHYDEEFWKER